MQAIGAGLGRTGTYSLKIALNTLGFEPCYHMEAVLHDRAARVPLWVAALEGRADWDRIFEGFQSAVDWPTAQFFDALSARYPDARFILTDRNPESWAASFEATIYKLIAERDQAPADLRPWLDMAAEVIRQSGFPAGLNRSQLAERFQAHNAAVKATIPSDRLLVYQVKQGWAPLCEFLRVPVPASDFPRTNDRAEFWELVNQDAQRD